jgi:uncharacterized protein
VSLSIFDTVVPGMIHGLNVMDDYLVHAARLAQSTSISIDEVLNARLAPDMLSFAEQISVLCNKADAHIANLARVDAPTPIKVQADAAALRARLAGTMRHLSEFAPDALAGAESHTYQLDPPIVRGWFSGTDYITLLVIPDFYFHVATAHAILRHLGAPIGKRDYLGNLTQESGGAY